MLAGAFGGIFAASVAIVVAAMLTIAIAMAMVVSRRVGMPIMKRVMGRMMRGRDLPPALRECMDKCGCAPKAEVQDAPPAVPAEPADSAGA
jgi:hypothetical protein